jgi:hypothetical protein
MASGTAGVRVGVIVGALLAAVPAIPISFVGVVFSFGDDPHPANGVFRAIFAGLMIIAAGAVCGGLVGAAVARFTK